MKRSIGKKKLTVLFVIICILGIVLMFFPGFKMNDSSEAKQQIVAYLEYGADFSDVDTEKLSSDVEEILGKSEVGINTNYTDGYDNLIITCSADVVINEPELLFMLQTAYSDLGITELKVSKIASAKTKTNCIFDIFMLWAVFTVFYCAAALFDKKNYLYNVAAMFISGSAALMSSVIFCVALRIPGGSYTNTAAVSSLLVSGIICGIYISRLKNTGKGKKNQESGSEFSEGHILLNVLTVALIVLAAGIGASLFCKSLVPFLYTSVAGASAVFAAVSSRAAVNTILAE